MADAMMPYVVKFSTLGFLVNSRLLNPLIQEIIRIEQNTD